MRHIKKGHEPRSLTNQRAALTGTPGVTDYYSLLTSPTKQDIMHQSIREQGGLCAYTNVRIHETSCHIEHMYPRNPDGGESSVSPLDSIDYSNMVLCYPGPEQEQKQGKLPYGAHAKQNWPGPDERHLFVRPTDATVESRFLYQWDGGITAADKDDAAATETIQRLGLCHDDLTYLRKAALAPLRHPSTGIKELSGRLKSCSPEAAVVEEFCVAKQQLIRKRLDALKGKRAALARRADR